MKVFVLTVHNEDSSRPLGVYETEDSAIKIVEKLAGFKIDELIVSKSGMSDQWTVMVHGETYPYWEVLGFKLLE